MIKVYDNMIGLSISQLLDKFGDELRTDAMVLKTIPELNIQFQLINPLDYPEIIVAKGEDEIYSKQISPETGDEQFLSIFSTWVGAGEYIELPYSVYVREVEKEKINKKVLEETKAFLHKISGRMELLNIDTKTAVLKALVSAFS